MCCLKSKNEEVVKGLTVKPHHFHKSTSRILHYTVLVFPNSEKVAWKKKIKTLFEALDLGIFYGSTNIVVRLE